MVVLGDVASAVIRRIFAEHTPDGRGPLVSPVLSEHWGANRLRRDDLAALIVAMLESGALRAERRDGEWHYFLAGQDAARQGGGDAAAAEGDAPPINDFAASRSGQVPARVMFGRRSTDRDAPCDRVMARGPGGSGG